MFSYLYAVIIVESLFFLLGARLRLTSTHILTRIVPTGEVDGSRHRAPPLLSIASETRECTMQCTGTSSQYYNRDTAISASRLQLLRCGSRTAATPLAARTTFLAPHKVRGSITPYWPTFIAPRCSRKSVGNVLLTPIKPDT